MNRRLNHLIRRGRRILAGPAPRPPRSLNESISTSIVAFEKIQTILRIFYVLTFALGIELLSAFPDDIDANGTMPLLLARWMKWIPPTHGIVGASALMMGGAIVSASCPHIKIARIASFLGLLLLLSARFSMGKIDHGFHFWLWSSLIFCLFPSHSFQDQRQRASTRQLHLLIFFSAQLMVALFFSLSGAWKIIAGCYQLAVGEFSLFSSTAMARQVADQFVSTHELTTLGELVVGHPAIGWLPYLTAVYLEVFSIAAVFRPNLHRLWGCALLLFQLGTRLILDVWSPWGIAAVGLLFVASPFAHGRSDCRAHILSLPGIGEALIALRRVKPESPPRA